MAHMIDFSNARANIAYVGETPWHNLGSKLPQGTGIEVWLKDAGLDWEAIKSPIFFNDKDNEIVKGNSEVVYRSDTKQELGVVTDRYKIVQPAEVLEFYRDLVATQGWSLDVAGSLDGGKRIWALAKTDAEINVLGSVDKVETYLLLATAFDGTMSTVGKFSSNRVVCQNTLTMSLNDGMAKVSVPHSTTFDATKVKEQLGLYETVAKQFEEEANTLAKRKMTDSEVMKFLIATLAGKDINTEDVSTRNANIIKGVFDLYKGRGRGATMASANGTAWGALNAVTQYYNHDINTRNNNNKLRSAWFGPAEATMMNAKKELLKVA